MAKIQVLSELRGIFWHENDQWTMLAQINDIEHLYDDFLKWGHITIGNCSETSRVERGFSTLQLSAENTLTVE